MTDDTGRHDIDAEVRRRRRYLVSLVGERRYLHDATVRHLIESCCLTTRNLLEMENEMMELGLTPPTQRREERAKVIAGMLDSLFDRNDCE